MLTFPYLTQAVRLWGSGNPANDGASTQSKGVYNMTTAFMRLSPLEYGYYNPHAWALGAYAGIAWKLLLYLPLGAQSGHLEVAMQ